MNNQTAFNIMTRHLLAQGSRSRLSNDTACAYRGVDGFSCAVGVLIPNEIYSESMEGLIVTELLRKFPKLDKVLENVDTGLLSRMQHIHDHECPDEWETEFERAARDYNLTLEV